MSTPRIHATRTLRKVCKKVHLRGPTAVSLSASWMDFSNLRVYKQRCSTLYILERLCVSTRDEKKASPKPCTVCSTVPLLLCQYGLVRTVRFSTVCRNGRKVNRDRKQEDSLPLPYRYSSLWYCTMPYRHSASAADVSGLRAR